MKFYRTGLIMQPVAQHVAQQLCTLSGVALAAAGGGAVSANTLVVPPRRTLTRELLLGEALRFSSLNLSMEKVAKDGKSIGTFVERRFNDFLASRYVFRSGNAALGLDFPELEVDVKTTSAKLRSSSAPFKSYREAVFGLGYDLLVFMYEPVIDFVPDGQTTAGQTVRITRTLYVDRKDTRDHKLLWQLAQCETPELRVNAVRARYPGASEADAEDIVREVTPELLGTVGTTTPAVSMCAALQWRLKYR